MKPRILFVYPNLPLMMAPAISIGIFHALALREDCDFKIFETTEYSNAYSNRHIRMTEIGANRPNKAEEVKDMFHIKPKSDIFPDLRQVVTEYKPNIIMMGVQEDVWGMASEILASIADLKIPNILGGVFPTAAAHIVLNNPHVDYIAIHEGERTFVDVINAIKNNTPLTDIRGLAYRDRFGLVQKNAPQPLCDITEVTPDFTCFEAKRWNRPMGGRVFSRAVSMETYRGCPYNCTYCNSPNTRDISKQNGTGNYLRRKTANIIERDLLYYKELYNPDLVMFQDDSFLARPKREIFEFCEMWSKYKIPFWFNTRVEDCDPDKLSALKTAGVYRMTFGIESGNEQYRNDVLERNGTNERYYEYFDYINASNIPYSLNVIIGMPFETREMVMDTARMVKRSQGYDGLTIGMFQPYHGAKLRQVAVDAGFLSADYISGNIDSDMGGGYLDSWALNMPEPYLQEADVRQLTRTFALYAHFDESRWPEIQAAETNDELYQELMQQYQAEFFGDVQQGGTDRISSKFCAKHDATSTYRFE
jgi:anaerobic magnesium-protoporphyrin IX monomethyl ester cyclase